MSAGGQISLSRIDRDWSFIVTDSVPREPGTETGPTLGCRFNIGRSQEVNSLLFKVFGPDQSAAFTLIATFLSGHREVSVSIAIAARALNEEIRLKRSPT